MDRNTEIVHAASAIVGDRHVLVEPDERVGYETDWTGRYRGSCIAVVRPANTAEVGEMLRACTRLGVAVVTQAGNTGLVGGGVPRADDAEHRPTVVLSMRRLDGISGLDAASMQITCGAGVTIAGWQRAARQAGLDTPVDFAARDSATVGGAIATNAGGSRVVRYGTMRQQVVGVEAVLADGTVVGSLAGLAKETVGIHWPSLVAGSEGTLAVITAARLRLVPRFEHVTTVFAALDDLESALSLLAAARRRLGSLDSIEIIWPDALDLVSSHLAASKLATSAPVEVPPHGVAVVIECADHVDPTADLHAVLADVAGVAATAIATDGARRGRLLAFRDRITDSIATAATESGTPTYKLDVAVPVGSLERLLDVARAAADRHGARLIPFGHLAEGNVHLNFLDATDPDGIAGDVLPIVAELGGTISAEHGVGIAKTKWLHLVRSPGELDALRSIRRALDPTGTLNPGVLDDPG
ncbi:MAG: FAD-binding oxidoreductase [Acidobacteriota bacterium]